MKTKHRTQECFSAVLIFILLFYLVAILFYFSKIYKHITCLFGILAGISILLFLKFVSKRIDSEICAISSILFSGIVLNNVWYCIYSPVPVSDYKALWEGACLLASGNPLVCDSPILLNSLNYLEPGSYFFVYNFQIPYAAYLAVLSFFFEGSLNHVIIFRSIIPALTATILYKSLCYLLERRIAWWASVVYIFYPFIFTGTGILNNQHEGMLFEALALYFYVVNLNSKGLIGGLYCGLFLAIAQILRPTASVILIAIWCYTLICFLTNHNYLFIKRAAIVTLSYFVIIFICNFLFIQSGIAPYGIISDNLYFKFIIGLTGKAMTHSGQSFSLDLKLYEFDINSYKNAAKIFLYEKIVNGEISLMFLFQKMIRFCSFPDNQISFGDRIFNVEYKMVIRMLQVTGMFIYLMGVLGALVKSVLMVINKSCKNAEIFNVASIIFILYFMAYIFIETQTRYRYEQYYMLFLTGMPIWYDIKGKVSGLLCKTN